MILLQHRIKIDFSSDLSHCQFSKYPSKIDAHYEEMFENGNFRRRRRMKRTYNRTSASHISRLYDSPYNSNYSSTARMYANPSYRYSYPDPA